jgi:hypothetical protein
MFNHAPGYFKVERESIEEDKFYVLCLKNLRKPHLLRFSCRTSFLAKRYIMLKPHPEWFEVIKGEEALYRGIKMTSKRLKVNEYPEKYLYPVTCTTWQKKKQHRTNIREKVRRIEHKSLPLVQYTISYRWNKYTIFEYVLSRAFKLLNKRTGISWGFFIREVSTTPTKVTKGITFLKTINVNIIAINQFTKKHHGHRINHTPSKSKISGLESPYLSIGRAKPKRILL